MTVRLSQRNQYQRNRALLLADGPVCVYCNEAPATEADHYIPRKHGGSDDLSNLVPACWRCNNTKRAQLPWEWRHQSVDQVEAGDW